MKFKVIQRGEPGVAGGGIQKYYAAPQPNRRMGIDELAEEISVISSLSTIDVVAVLHSFIERLPVHLSRGNTIVLGQLGTLRVSLSSNGETTAEEVTSSSIRARRLLFRPGRKLLRMLKTMTFVKSD